MGGALVAGLVRRSFLSLAALFVLAGFALGQGGLEVLDFDPRSGFVHDLAVVALIVILFRDGLEVESEMLQTAWRLPLRKLALGDADHGRADRAGRALDRRPRLARVAACSARCCRRPTRCCPPRSSPTRACRGSCATR